MNAGVILLAGGQSSRMGMNKALLPINGQQNIVRIIEELTRVFPPPILVTNQPEDYETIGLKMIGDKYPGKGPLAGLHAGLMASPYEDNLLVACDMPFASSRLGEFLWSQLEGYDAVVPVLNGKHHPLFAVYRKSTLPVVEECLEQERLRMFDFLKQIQVNEIHVEDSSLEMDLEKAFFNMNRPSDFEQAKEWAGKE
ncbi:molybdenum cofactor guanylyltransferase [Ammoniphilus sp. CFH 90114]|uniref:molybdenum cofactor guanylyltransferase n=1 Tax=Ammoniphilus sp. CFH 90114 TaxID=2493665 RepID=UPI00101003C0|nr:molybdenum cofactor guanylyltransferase [Ammoniphilus sp. CFH 90114]RXT07884.1 molybdenum cofactor guanylyltransferase [Ammoniphilus sp. CFH 90114]